MRRLIVITTGGTIEKVFDEGSGELVNRASLVSRMLDELRIEDSEISVIELTSKDSLHMTAGDRGLILDASVLGPGVYLVAHGRALAFPGVPKDRASGTFIRDEPGS